MAGEQRKQKVASSEQNEIRDKTGKKKHNMEKEMQPMPSVSTFENYDRTCSINPLIKVNPKFWIDLNGVNAIEGTGSKNRR